MEITTVLKCWLSLFHKCESYALTSSCNRTGLGYIRTRVPELLEPEFWPPHSPDLNPLDYCLWGYIESAIHKHRHVTDFEELKQEIKKAWKAIPQEVVNKSILVFRKRLRMCIEANGGHIEQFL